MTVRPRQFSKLGTVEDLDIVVEFFVLVFLKDLPREPGRDCSEICLSIFIFVNLMPNWLLKTLKGFSGSCCAD